MRDKPQKIGDSVWIYDSDHRVYRADEKGQHIRGQSPIYRESWRQHFIVGENRVSWIVASSPDAKPDQKWRCKKVSKKPRPVAVEVRGVAYSAEEVESAVWARDHRWRIIRMIEHADSDTLRQIAEIVGYQA